MRAAPEPSEPVARVLRALPGGARWTGHEYRGRCPTHNDRTPSLTIGEGDDGRALIKCHANCDTADVIAEIGLDWPDLFPRTAATGGPTWRTVVAQYLYCDERGEPLYRVVRSDPKSFRLESFNGEGWQHGRDCMQGVRRVLYRLSDVLVAVAAGEAIYITEGEKDADLVATRGECATTNAGGAGKWSTIPDAQEVLRGAQVFVVADRDLAGWRRALEVRETLSRVAHVTVVASAVGKDFGDHVEAGYGLNDLVVRDPGLEMAGLEMDQEAEVITYSRVPRAISRNPRLDDADVRLFAVVDEMPGRTISGRNFVAKVLGWRPAKVTEHAEHLVAAGFFHVTEHPSGDGHKATTYRAVNNPVREGSGSDSSHLRARGGSDSSRPGRGSGSLSVHSHSLSESECAYAVFEGGREDDFVGAPFFDIDDDRVDEILESDDDPGPNDRDLERYGGGDEPVRTA